ncbi:Terminase-like family protein [compost metagenome]
MPEVPLAPMVALQRVRAWDISGTLPSDTNPNPDWTAGVLMSKDKHSLYYIEDVVRDRRLYGGVFDLILETARRDGAETTILIPCDPGAAGKAYAGQLVRELAEHGFVARMKATNKSKVTRFAPFSALSEAGGVRIVRGPWTDTYLDELERFDGSRNIKDDQVDATGDAFTHLASNLHIPDFMPPDMKQVNPFAIYR